MYRRVAVKVGSNVLAGANGDLDVGRIGHIVDQIANLKRTGTEVVLISSGAVRPAGQEFLSTQNWILFQ